MYGSINGFNVADNLKKLINKKNHTVFIENPLGENMIEQSKQFFVKIYGLDPIKENIYRALLAKDQVNVLLIGPPATSKTLFMTIIQERCNDVCYFDAANTSGAGFIDFLFNHQKSKILIIDEIDKLKKNDLNSLLGILNNGKINKNLKNITYNFSIKCKILATSNSNTKLSKPMRSRFQEYHLPEYSNEEYIKVVKFCLNKDIDPTISETIARSLLAHDRKDVRAAISISNLLQINDTVEDIARVVDTWINYKSHDIIDYN
ncbi:MAG TPA: ATP-binding protein [Candidatus Nitrosocosmicus sp.]